MINAVVSLSGGLDSAVLLADLLRANSADSIVAVTFVYGSRHNAAEIRAAADLADHYKLKDRWRMLNVNPVFEDFKSALLCGQGEVPDGPPDSPSMKQTVVPCRNLIFASILAGLADSLNSPKIALGMHAGDAYTYPDCRPLFVNALNETIRKATESRVGVFAPYLDWDKSMIVRHGHGMSVPFNKSWSCYRGGRTPCGTCSACVGRREAFAKNKLPDFYGPVSDSFSL